MDKGYKIRNNDGIYFLTFTIVEWVDVFTRNDYSDIIVESLKYCQQHKGLIIYSWCIMSNHVHLIVASKEGFNLSDTIRDFKKFTSKEILSSIEKNKRESRKKWMLRIFRSAGNVNKQYKVPVLATK